MRRPPLLARSAAACPLRVLVPSSRRDWVSLLAPLAAPRQDPAGTTLRRRSPLLPRRERERVRASLPRSTYGASADGGVTSGVKASVRSVLGSWLGRARLAG